MAELRVATLARTNYFRGCSRLFLPALFVTEWSPSMDAMWVWRSGQSAKFDWLLMAPERVLRRARFAREPERRLRCGRCASGASRARLRGRRPRRQRRRFARGFRCRSAADNSFAADECLRREASAIRVVLRLPFAGWRLMYWMRPESADRGWCDDRLSARAARRPVRRSAPGACRRDIR